MIHLDTNFLIQALVERSSPDDRLRDWMLAGETVTVRTVAWAEFLCGPLTSFDESMARQVFPKPTPFLETDAALAAQLFNKTGRRSRSLADCMIAAVAIRCDARLATINQSDFTPFAELGLTLQELH